MIDNSCLPSRVENGTCGGFAREWKAPKGESKKMEWTRSDTIALAMQCCSECHGLGLKSNLRGTSSPCNCVLRAVFRACYARFRHCASKEKHMSQASLEVISGKDSVRTWGRKDEEYIADFCQVSRKALDEFEYRVFKYHFLLGADWRLCTRKLEMDRGNFFHSVYRVEQKLGKVFRELQPYGLYPVHEYFHGTRQMPREWSLEAAKLNPLGALRGPFRAPLLQTA
jgi:hypothetical protein